MDATAHPYSEPALAPDRLVLTPVVAAPSVPGRVLSYETGMAGLAVRLTAQVHPEGAERLDAERVWVTANTQGRLIAFQSVAHRTGETAMDVNGITAPVEEHRRAQLRAATRTPARLQVGDPDGGEPTVLTGHTVDVSRGGCRVELPDVAVDEALQVGATADVTLDLGTRPVVTAGKVLRVDPDTGQAVLTFGTLTTEDADQIERHVLSDVL